MPITNVQLATSSHIPEKLNRWNTPYSVTINIPEEIKGNTVTLETRTLESILLFSLDQNINWAKIPKLVKNKTKWIKKQFDMKKPSTVLWTSILWEEFFFTNFMQLAEERGKNQSPTGLNTIHKHVTFKVSQTGEYLLVI